MKAEGGRVRCMMRMMWSAFLVAIPAEGLFFSLLDMIRVKMSISKISNQFIRNHVDTFC